MNESELVTLLKKHGIDTTRFDRGKAKSLANLLDEVNAGIIFLVEREGKLCGYIDVVSMNIYAQVISTRLRLVEKGTNSPISEKLGLGEEPLGGVGRFLRRFGIRRFTIPVPITYAKIEENDSPAYPGISFLYQTYGVVVELAPLDYKEEGYQEVKSGAPHFVWRRT